jgi:predicted aldo/keto reductase-like oxidoreductase
MPADLPRREYGKSGDRLSVVGMGGIVVMGMEQAEASRVVARAVERGVNYFDVAPSYGDAELKLGPALEPYRKDVFLACKTAERSKEGAQRELASSFESLRTDRFDLYQLHGLTDVEKDVDAAFAKGGAMEVFTEAKRSGQVRHLGFSAHTEEAAFAAMDRYDFDSVLFPVNFACWLKGGVGPGLVEKAKAAGMSVLAIKSLAREPWREGDPCRSEYPNCWYRPLTDPAEAKLALRFTLSRPVTAAVSPGSEKLFFMALDAALETEPFSEAEMDETRRLAETVEPIFRKP